MQQGGWGDDALPSSGFIWTIYKWLQVASVLQYIQIHYLIHYSLFSSYSIHYYPILLDCLPFFFLLFSFLFLFPLSLCCCCLFEDCEAVLSCLVSSRLLLSCYCLVCDVGQQHSHLFYNSSHCTALYSTATGSQLLARAVIVIRVDY